MASALGAGLRWALPAASAAAGVALRDCLFLSASGPLALGAFYLGMDARAAADGLRTGARCALAGMASLAAAVALVAAVLAALHGAWNPEHDHYYAGAWLLAGAVIAFLALSRADAPVVPEGMSRASATAIAALAVAAAAFAVVAGLPWSLCALPVATAALMAMAGWRLIAEVAPAMLAVAYRR